MNAKAIISTLPYKIKADAETELWRRYMARCVRAISENTAQSVQGKFISAEYSDIIDPKPTDKRSADEIINGIKAKIKS